MKSFIYFYFSPTPLDFHHSDSFIFTEDGYLNKHSTSFFFSFFLLTLQSGDNKNSIYIRNWLNNDFFLILLCIYLFIIYTVINEDNFWLYAKMFLYVIIKLKEKQKNVLQRRNGKTRTRILHQYPGKIFNYIKIDRAEGYWSKRPYYFINFFIFCLIRSNNIFTWYFLIIILCVYFI